MSVRLQRVLHLLSPASGDDQATLACAGVLSHSASPWTQEAIIIGSKRDQARSARMGVCNAGRVQSAGMGGGSVECLLPRIARLFRDRDAAGAAPELVQVWCPATLRLAVLARALGMFDAPICAMFTTADRLSHVLMNSWLNRMAMSRVSSGIAGAGVVIATASESIADCFVRTLTPEVAAELSARVRVIPAILPPLRPLLPPCREQMRSTLGISPIQQVVGLWSPCSQSPGSSSDARRHEGGAGVLAFALGLLHATGREAIGVVRSEQPDLHRATRFIRAHGSRWGLVHTPLALPDFALVVDILVIDQPLAMGSERFSPASFDPVCVMLQRKLRGSMLMCATVPGLFSPSNIDRVRVCPRNAGQLARELISWHDAPHNGVSQFGIDDPPSHELSGSFATEPSLLALWAEMLNLPASMPGLPTPHRIRVSSGGLA